MARQRMARLTRRDHKQRAIGIRKVIDTAKPGRMDVLKRVRTGAFGPTTHQSVVTARSRLADIDEPRQDRDRAQHLMVMRGLMRVAPTPAFDIGAVFLGQPDQRVIQRQSRDVGAGLNRGRLQHIAPSGGTVRVAENPLDENWL